MIEADFFTNIQCDVELSVQGKDLAKAAGRLALIQRELADCIKDGDLSDGFRTVKSPEGRSAGQVYYDLSKGTVWLDPDETAH